MGHEIHKIKTPEGEKFRVFSNGSNTYISNELNIDQLRLFSKMMQIDSVLSQLCYENLEENSFQRWLSNSENLNEWKEEQQFSPSTEKRRNEYREMVKKQIALLKEITEKWEKFSFEGTV